MTRQPACRSPPGAARVSSRHALPRINSWRQIMVPSVTGTLPKIHFDIEREQSIKQRRLAIIMPGLEAAVADLFAAVLEQTKPQQTPQHSGLHGVGRPVPCPRQNGRLRDGTQPRQLL